MAFFNQSNYDLCIVALGNPGTEYAKTRHNTGWIMLDALAEKHGVSINKLKHKAECGVLELKGKKILLMKPQTYMNLSGESVGEAARYYKIPADKILVVCDDISRPFGKMRLRLKGSAGGHNGLKNIELHLGTQEYPRVKFGIGDRENKEMDLRDWVLGKFTPDEVKTIESQVSSLEGIALLIADGKGQEAISRYSH